MDEVYSADSPAEPAATEILAALDGMLASEALRLSDRNRRFLSFVVRQAVAGRSDRIKAYVIGVDVFGRDDRFDPTLDPIVRIEANRLRTALTAYYDGEGASDGIVITIPRGSYVPSFSRGHDEPKALDSVPAASRRGVKTLILSDCSGNSDPDTELRGELFTDSLLVALREAHFQVRMLPSREHSAAAGAISALFAEPGGACSVDIAVRSLGDSRRYSWRLIDLGNGEVLGSEFREFTIKAKPCFDLIDEFAVAAAGMISALLHGERRGRSAAGL